MSFPFWHSISSPQLKPITEFLEGLLYRESNATGVFFFSVGAFRSKDVSTYPVGILWRTRETSWPSVGTIDTQLTGCSHVSWDLDPRVRDGTWGALNTGACDEGLSQDAHLRALIMCPLVEPLRGKRGCAFFQLLLDFLVLSSTFLAEWDSLSFSFF